MPPKAPADGVSAAPPKRARKAVTPASAAKVKSKPVAATMPKPKPAPKPAAVPAAPAADTAAQRRIGGGWLAVGVGSAALVAALLFATRGKRNDWSK